MCSLIAIYRQLFYITFVKVGGVLAMPLNLSHTMVSYRVELMVGMTIEFLSLREAAKKQSSWNE